MTNQDQIFIHGSESISKTFQKNDNGERKPKQKRLFSYIENDSPFIDNIVIFWGELSPATESPLISRSSDMIEQLPIQHRLCIFIIN